MGETLKPLSYRFALCAVLTVACVTAGFLGRPAVAADPNDSTIVQATPAATPTATPTPTPEYLWESYLDGSYVASGKSTLTFLTPGSGIPDRVFDTRPNLATLNAVNVQVTKTANTSYGIMGWKLEASFGNDANTLASYNSSQLVPTPTQAGQACGSPGASPVFSTPYFPFVNPYKCLGNGLYYHVGGFDVTQAYFNFVTPDGKFNLTLGKFNTLAGYEVIESPSDFNFSRSILFGYAVPFTHTGIRLTYNPWSTVTVNLGVNNGWDDIVGTGKALGTLESQIAYSNPASPLSGDIDFYTGIEPAAYGNASGFALPYCPTLATSLSVPPTSCTGLTPPGTVTNPVIGGVVYPVVGPKGERSLIDVVGNYKVFPNLTVGANYDIGSQTNTCCIATTTTGALWDGVAAYVNYSFGAPGGGPYAITARGETFSDPQGYRTGTAIPNFRWNEGTFTTQWKATPNLTARAEYRFDYTPGSPVPVFAQNITYPGGATGVSKTQGSFNAELIVNYP